MQKKPFYLEEINYFCQNLKKTFKMDDGPASFLSLVLTRYFRMLR